ncbi:NAD(P)-dependent oxidoreductase [Arthrobacter sp. Leaf337]|uniref:NAD-dependent epimerase/dehydratase family protein n=1 Tax=Arthrobacter sp. Leaf337 TaxID=1736342 RepID=UPI0006FF9FAD|nr:NAD-dependent epimerase/dehydratase family protein [Arthrobacter sp. Leaf337]KQR80144.1 NAD(P)-dependent oxidoreductase [Arthrobacter sp. Leaf337]
MTVLLAGCGDLGTEAGLRFAAAGHRVVGWRRSPDKLPAAIEGARADLTVPPLPPIPADTTAVVVAVAASSPTEEAYRAAYVDGLSNVLDALARDRNHDGAASPSLLRRVLFVSSTAVYGDAGGGWVDESTTPAPGGFSGRIIREAEDLLHQRLLGTGISPVVLRLGGIYGPGRTRLIDQVRSGAATAPAEPRYTNRIHRDDAAAAIVHLCTMAAEPAPVYLGVDNDPAELGEVQRYLADELGLPLPASDVPGGSGGAGGGSGGGEPSRGGNKRCSNALLRSTGFEFAYPTFREGYRSILAGEGVRHP